jgi:hypothetical protein
LDGMFLILAKISELRLSCLLHHVAFPLEKLSLTLSHSKIEMNFPELGGLGISHMCNCWRTGESSNWVPGVESILD